MPDISTDKAVLRRSLIISLFFHLHVERNLVSYEEINHCLMPFFILGLLVEGITDLGFTQTASGAYIEVNPLLYEMIDLGIIRIDTGDGLIHFETRARSLLLTMGHESPPAPFDRPKAKMSVSKAAEVALNMLRQKIFFVQGIHQTGYGSSLFPGA